MAPRQGLRLPVPPMVVGAYFPGTELDADDSGTRPVLQAHHVAEVGADLPEAMPVAGRRRPALQLNTCGTLTKVTLPPPRTPPLVSVKIIFPPTESCQVPCKDLSWANCSPFALHTTGGARKIRCRTNSTAHARTTAAVTSVSSRNRHPRREICPGALTFPETATPSLPGADAVPGAGQLRPDSRSACAGTTEIVMVRSRAAENDVPDRHRQPGWAPAWPPSASASWLAC